MPYIIQYFYAFLSTAGFAVIFNAPKDSIIKSSFGGATSWIIFMVSNKYFSSPIIGTFLGAITVGLFGELMAKKYRKPATIFIIPGIVPLVPGAGMYYTMLEIINRDFISAAESGTEAIFIAVSIAIGIIVSSSITRAIFRQISKKISYK